MPHDRFSGCVRRTGLCYTRALKFVIFGLLLIFALDMHNEPSIGRRRLRASALLESPDSNDASFEEERLRLTSLFESPDSDDALFEIPAYDRSDISASSLAANATVPGPLSPYSFLDVLRTVLHYSTKMRWTSGCKKLVKAFKLLAHSLRLVNPARFHQHAPEFALAISSADYPSIEWSDCLLQQRLDCHSADELAPVLQFGSVFRRNLLPTTIGMPVPQKNHLSCYHSWTATRQVCRPYLPRETGNPEGLVFPETIGVRSWDQLVPQIVWRGTDFSYLHKMHPNLRQPNFESDVASKIVASKKSGNVDERIAATLFMRQAYDELLPRWKGVVWTAEAEREAET